MYFIEMNKIKKKATAPQLNLEHEHSAGLGYFRLPFKINPGSKKNYWLKSLWSMKVHKKTI